MKKYIFLISLLGNIVLPANSQFNIKPEDMLRISQQYPWGTARAMGMGGAFGALGGDMTSLSLNPAGIGIYRSSEFTFSPSVNFNTTNSTLPASASTTNIPYSGSDFAQRLHISNIGYVYNMNTNKEEGWVSASFGIAYNRLNDFDRNIIMKTPSANSSLLDEFVYYANDAGNGPLSPDGMYPFYEKLAYQTFAIDNVLYSDNWWHSDYSADHQYGESQIRRREIRGGLGEYAFSFGANYSNKFYLGMTIGVQSLNYTDKTIHTEEDLNNTIPNLKSFDFTEHFNITGSGYNFKFGILYKPIDLLRLGVAVHSPTYYNLESEFYTSMNSYFDLPLADGQSSSGGNSEITRTQNNNLLTPWRFIGSASLQLQQVGLISVDYERLNYSNMRLSGDMGSNNPNDELSSTLKSVNNLRIGAEGKIGALAIRGGIGFYGTPYKTSPLNKINYTTYSAGLGYRGKSFFLDLAYVLFKYSSDKYLLYSYKEVVGTTTPQDWANNPVIANSDYKLNQFVATLGFKF